MGHAAVSAVAVIAAQEGAALLLYGTVQADLNWLLLPVVCQQVAVR